VNLVNALRKGGDFDAYFDAGTRLVRHEPLYAGSTIAQGFVGPPAQALLFVPLVPMGHDAARLAWYAINLALLWYGLATWLGLLIARSPSSGTRPAWRDGTAQFTASISLLSILAIAQPLQSQFEHQNLNVVLLALIAYAADALMRGRDAVAGLTLGAAAAIKV